MTIEIEQVVEVLLKTIIPSVFGIVGTWILFGTKLMGMNYSNLSSQIKDLKNEIEEKERKCETLTDIQFELKSKIISLEQENSLLSSRLRVVQHSILELPIPIWLKDTSGVMLMLNDAYERLLLTPIGKTREDYINKTDYDMWSQEIAREYIRTDQQVIHSGRMYEKMEPFVDSFGKPTKVRVIKCPVYAVSSIVVGVLGILIPNSDKSENGILDPESFFFSE